MIITTQQTKNGKIGVFTDGEYRFSVSPEYWYSLGIQEEDEIDEERFAQIEQDTENAKCLANAYSYLARNAHTTAMLKQKLSRKYSGEAVQFALERAAQMGLLDDGQYAEDYAEELLRLRHYAPARIRGELAAKGISREDADRAVSLLEYDSEAQIAALLEGKFSRKLQEKQGVEKTIRALQRMGYSYSDIKKALSGFVTDEVLQDE